MRILVLTSKFPFPARDGYAVMVQNFLEGFVSMGMEVQLVALCTRKFPFAPEAIPVQLRSAVRIHEVMVDNELHWFPAASCLIRGESYHMYRFDHLEAHSKLKEVLRHRDFDIVQFEGLYTAPYVRTVRASSKACLSMRAHNVEYMIWQRMLENAPFGVRRLYLGHLVGLLKKYEIGKLNDYDVMIPISRQVDELFRSHGCRLPGLVVPFAVQMSRYDRSADAVNPNSLCFLGSLDWRPNLEGLEWFIECVWPEVRERCPGLTFHVAGRNPGHWQPKADERVIMHGEVEDAVDFMSAYDLVVVPLLSGSGMRIKIVEAMALGKAVVSTRVGAEGIESRPDREMIVRDDREAFADAVIELVKNRSKRDELGRNARELVHREYSLESRLLSLLRFYDEACS